MVTMAVARTLVPRRSVPARRAGQLISTERRAVRMLAPSEQLARQLRSKSTLMSVLSMAMICR